MPEALLDIRNLTVAFDDHAGQVAGIDDLSLRLDVGDSLAVVGESGAGKTSLALSIMGLLPNPGARIRCGSIQFDGQDLTRLPERARRQLRGSRIALVPQNPMNALNPVQPLGRQLASVFRRHRGSSRRQARSLALEMLERLQLAQPERLLNRYPHQLSGGMRQRVLIALALAGQPKLLIADEATSALDITTRGRVLEQVRALCAESQTALLLISHDFGIVAGNCRQVAVMYCGQVVEQAPVDDLFESPHHPYTAGLIAAIPRLDEPPKKRLSTIPGQPPRPDQLGQGCRFASRCPGAQIRCAQENPGVTRGSSREYRCHFPLRG